MSIWCHDQYAIIAIYGVKVLALENKIRWMIRRLYIVTYLAEIGQKQKFLLIQLVLSIKFVSAIWRTRSIARQYEPILFWHDEQDIMYVVAISHKHFWIVIFINTKYGLINKVFLTKNIVFQLVSTSCNF